MQARQAHVLGSDGLFDGAAGGPVGDRQTEFLVFVGGGDVLVPARVDAGRHAQHDVGDDAAFGRDRIDQGELGQGVDDQVADPVVQGQADLLARLVVAVQPDAGPGDACRQRRRQLALRARVDSQPLHRGGARHGDAQERLARVVDVGLGQVGEGLLHRRLPGACAPGEFGLVQHVQGRAELGDELADRHPAHRELAGVEASERRRPHARRRAVGFGSRKDVEAVDHGCSFRA